MIVEEFKRAVLIATGGVLGDHIVNIVFQLFDIDGTVAFPFIFSWIKSSKIFEKLILHVTTL